MAWQHGNKPLSGAQFGAMKEEDKKKGPGWRNMRVAMPKIPGISSPKVPKVPGLGKGMKFYGE